MASTTLATLLQQVKQCVDYIQTCEKECADLAVKHESCEFWLLGVAGAYKKLAADLSPWLRDAKTRKNEQDAVRFAQELEEHSRRCTYMLEILRHAWGEVQRRVHEPSLDLAMRQDIEHEVHEDIKAVRLLVETLKSLSSFFKKGLPIPHGSRYSVGNADLRALFSNRIDQINPSQRARSFSVLHRGCVDFHKIDMFWDCILRPEGMYPTTDRSKTFDGILIKAEHVAKARNTLESFRDAWLDSNPHGADTYPKDPDSLDAITSMPIIACVLRACGMEELFNDFVDFEIYDSALDQSLEGFLFTVGRALKIQKRGFDANEVVAQFSRAKQRPWPTGTKLSLVWCEPLPLLWGRALRTRSNTPALGVYEVRDAWNPSQHYALKVMKPGTATKRQRQELINEIDRLLELGKFDHGHHIVRCIKTYERAGGQEFGMLMTPVADGDLNMMLIRCCTDAAFRERHRSELIMACACLTYSLAFLHNVMGIRHRDVKPHNVLHHKSDAKTPAEFVWADFGLATVFREQCFSGTKNPGFGATPEYEAPEVDPEGDGMHTRASDIFALGCMFLEVACVLAMPKDKRRDTIEIRSLYWHENTYYKHHLKGLAASMKDWEKIFTTNKDHQALTILKLARGMVSQKADDRPKVGKATLDLYKAHPEMFCPKCLEKIKADRSGKSEHPNIFVHRTDIQMSLPSTPANAHSPRMR